jgi:hypothetical protein
MTSDRQERNQNLQRGSYKQVRQERNLQAVQIPQWLILIAIKMRLFSRTREQGAGGNTRPIAAPL